MADLVKKTQKKQEEPRRGRGSAVSTERRYRYPAEEIWQVSEDRWQVTEKDADLTRSAPR